MKVLTLLSALFLSFSTIAHADKNACVLEYDTMSDHTSSIHYDYYEVKKFNEFGIFEVRKQWACDDENIAEEVNIFLLENCTVINLKGIALETDEKSGTFNIIYACG